MISRLWSAVGKGSRRPAETFADGPIWTQCPRPRPSPRCDRTSDRLAATFENVRRDHQGGFVFDLGRSKTNQAGARAPENATPIVGEAAVALESWLNELFRAKITEGAIFRRIHQGNITEPLRDQAVWSIVRSRAKLVDPPLRKVTAHSLRSGFVTESGRQHIPIGEAMALTGHRSAQTFIGYYRNGEVTNSAAARLMDSEPRPSPGFDWGLEIL